MKDELSSSSPLYLRLPTTTSPDHQDHIEYIGDIFYPECTDYAEIEVQKIGDDEGVRAISIIDMDNFVSLEGDQEQETEDNELD